MAVHQVGQVSFSRIWNWIFSHKYSEHFEWETKVKVTLILKSKKKSKTNSHKNSENLNWMVEETPSQTYSLWSSTYLGAKYIFTILWNIWVLNPWELEAFEGEIFYAEHEEIPGKEHFI